MSIPPARRLNYQPNTSIRPEQVKGKRFLTFFAFLKLLPILPAYEPVEGGGRVYPRRVCDGGELGEIRKRWALRIFPRLPR